MSRIQIYTDEDVLGNVAPALVRRGIYATTTPQQGNLELSDEQQLRFATHIGAVLLTHNIQDFPRLHYEMLNAGESHCGIIVAKQRLSIGEIVRRVLHLAFTLEANDMVDRLEYLSHWEPNSTSYVAFGNLPPSSGLGVFFRVATNAFRLLQLWTGSPVSP